MAVLIDILNEQQKQQNDLNYLLGKPIFYNLKHIEYLNSEEYRIYEYPFKSEACQTDKIEYIDIDGVQYNKITGQQRTDESIEHSKNSSLSRTKQKIYDYAFCNDWSDGWFLTFTFDNDKVENRYDYDICYKRINTFLRVLKRNNSDCKYLIVPERHKDGAWHFHGLLTNCDNLKMVDSGKFSKGKHIYNHEVKGSKKIYNINSRNWKYGFTTATKIEDTKKVSSYITKYITKDLIETTKGKHRYIYSKNLDLPIITNTFETDNDLTEQLLTQHNNNFEYEKKYASDRFGTIKYIHLKK